MTMLAPVLELEVSKPRFRMRACEHCGGDQFLDHEERHVCLQCGHLSPDESLLLALAHLDLQLANLRKETNRR